MMAEEMDVILRKSLDAVDRARRRQWVYLALCFGCLSLFLFSIWTTAQNNQALRPGLGAEVLVTAILSILTNILVILGLSLFINRMTNKILKAIELLSKQ